MIVYDANNTLLLKLTTITIFVISWTESFIITPRSITTYDPSIIEVNGYQTTSSLNASVGKIPKTLKERNQQAARAVQKAITNPRTPSYKLIECEFPPLYELNKLGDGSLRSSQQVDDANLETVKIIIQTLSNPLSSIFGGGPAIWLIISSTATQNFQRKAMKVIGNNNNNKSNFIHSVRDGLPAVKSRDICIFISPSNNQDYDAAKRIVSNGNPVVIVNGLAKDRKSISGDATMAYYLKPLTYNSQIAGYLIRTYPDLWTTIDINTNKILGTFTDEQILVSGTNTPDLRDSVRQVQKAVDERIIQARNKK